MKNLLILFLLLTTSFVSAQIVNIPDANFKAELIAEGVDTNNDGEIQVSEAAAVSPILDVSNALISDLEGIQAFTSITNLRCDSNQLTFLNLSGNPNLTFVTCRFNDLATLNVSSNSNLVQILADGNDLTTLDLPNHPNLETLWISNNDLTSLDLSNCPNLQELSCQNNLLTSLNLTGSPLLQDLKCGGNNLSTLDLSSNINLTSLVVIQNQLTALDISNNTNLTYLDCGINDLADIDVTNNLLLEHLAVYGNSLTTLDCSFNTNLTALYLVNNPLLETVFIKNGSDESSNMDQGSWLENWILGNNPSLAYVCADDFQTVEIQQFAGTDYPVDSFCSFSPGGDVNTITGVSKFDTNGDGCDAGDSSIPYTSYNVDFNGVATNTIAYSNRFGIYNVYAGQIGTYTLTPNQENPDYFSISPSPADVVIPVIDNSIITQNFCVEAVGVRPDLEVVIAPLLPARPGFEATYALVYKNKGNQTLSGDVLFNYDEDRMDFVSATTTPDIQDPGMLTFNFTDLQPYQTEVIEIVLDVNSPTDTPPVNIDDVLVLFADINPIAGDETPLDNSFTLDQIVIGSYDPNNVICIQGEEVSTTYIGNYLHYVINFENTGTAPAENVVVTMEIDPTDFDRNTLHILSASHEMQAVINDNIAEFHFQSIDLDTGGHGNILFKIKTNSNLLDTDEVGVDANIYFDYNFPILTNEALTSFTTLGVDGYDVSQIAVYPNPANDIVNIQSSSVINSITVYDVQGRKIQAAAVNTQNTEVNISGLNSGIYFFSIETENGSSMKKVLKR